MLRNMNALIGYAVLATDGEIGTVDDLLFDDVSWSTAYLVVSIGRNSLGRRVLLPPTALGKPDSEHLHFPVAYSREQIAASPGVDIDRPVSRQRDKHWFTNYRCPPYWIFSGEELIYPLPSDQAEETDPHLLSVKDVVRYSVQTIDGKIGNLEDLVAEDATWEVRYMIVDSGEHLSEQKLLVSPQFVQRIAWTDEIVYMDITTRAIRRGSPHDTTRPDNANAPGLQLIWLTEGERAAH